MPKSAAHGGRLLVLAGCAAAVVAGAAALRADQLVGLGFRLVLEAHGGEASLELAAQGRRLQAEVGDEGYWLTRAEVASAAPFSKPLAIGDRITIADGGGRERRLQVVDVKPIGVPLFRVAAGRPPVQLLLVTCRDLDAAGGDGAPVRFIIESETAEPAPQPRQPAPKAL